MTLNHAVGATREAYDDAFNPRLASPSLRVPGSLGKRWPPHGDGSGGGSITIVRLICITVAFAGLFSPFSSNSDFPALPTIAASLQVSISKVNLTVTLFRIFQGLNPTLWAAVWDDMGRRPVYIATTTLYLCSNIGLSFTYHYWLLLLLCCVQSMGCASVVALGCGTIGVLIPLARRGGWMSIYNVFTMIGPAICPVVGGLLANSFDWHAILHLLAVFSAVVFVLLIVVLPENDKIMAREEQKRKEEEEGKAEP